MIHSLTIEVTDGRGGLAVQGKLAVSFDRFDGSHDQYAYRVECLGDVLAEGSDLRMPRASGIKHVEAMAALCTFLLADGEKYSAAMRGGETTSQSVEDRFGDGYLFNEKTAEWAYGMSDELAIVRGELVPEDDDQPAEAEYGEHNPGIVLEEPSNEPSAPVSDGARAFQNGVDEQEDERLTEPEEPRSFPYSFEGRERFAVQRRYTEASSAAHHSGLQVGYWGDVVVGRRLESMRSQFEWGARGGRTPEGVMVAPLSQSLKADERIVRVIGGETVEVLDEALYDRRRIVAVYEGWLIRRYEMGNQLDKGYQLDAVQLDGPGISQGYEADELDTLKDWIDGAPNRVKSCQCETGSRERAKYGNVHTDEEGR